MRVRLLTEPRQIYQVRAYVVAGSTAQLGDAAFVAELEDWIRFNADKATREGDGLHWGGSGNPSVPRWLSHLAMRWVLTP